MKHCGQLIVGGALLIAVALSSRSSWAAPTSTSAIPTSIPASRPTPSSVPSAGGVTSLRAGSSPWSRGVAPAQREQALTRFRRANQLFARSKYAEAAKVYRAALKLWSHPAIHGNLAVALIYLDDPVAARRHIDEALRYPTALEKHVRQQLLAHRRLIEMQIAVVEVVCRTPGAKVLINGESMLSKPGRVRLTLRVGRYAVVARKAGYLTFARDVTLLPGSRIEVEVKLIPLGEAGGFVRRWKPWKTWLIMGAGAAVLAAGVGLELSSRSALNSYDDEISRLCPTGCEAETLPQAVRDLKDRGRLESGLAVGALIVGGLTLTTGVVMTLLNQPRRVHLDESGRRVGLAPWLAPTSAGLSFSTSY